MVVSPLRLPRVVHRRARHPYERGVPDRATRRPRAWWCRVSRLPNQPGELINRNNVIRFTFDGKPVEAYEGDTIASALYAAGRRTFSRSFKYHRRRGLMCVSGQCPNCICAVDGNPGVRACTEPVRDGIAVTHVNARPSLEFDAMRATDIFGSRLTPPGFYYKTFI